MSARTPVVLVALPNLPYLLGTFDTANFRNWWRSAPFPEAIAELKKGLHIYGRSHLAIARRVDGRWAVYRSKDYGINWERAWLASAGEVIYDIVLINFGWAIMNTSAGFYETQTAGTSWTKVSNLPGASVVPAFCNIGGGDVLLCTDGRYIWRSTDIARHWTLVCDMHQVPHYVDWYPNYGYANPYYYTDLSLPAIAGACGRIYAANGPFLVRSDEGGNPGTWKGVSTWEHFASVASAPPRNVIYYRLWPATPVKFLINQITISSVDGPTGDDAVYLIRLDDRCPVSGETELYSWTFRTYSMTYLEPGTPAPRYYKNNFFAPVFRQYLVPSDSGQRIDAYDVSVLGASYNDKLVFSAQTRTDPITGQLIPSLKYSRNGGEDWIDIDLNKVKIGDPSLGTVYDVSMVDDNFAKLTWVAAPCNNAGSYDFIELYRRQCQSYELDINIAGKGIVSSPFDANICAERNIEQDIDAVLEGQIRKHYQADALCEGRQARSYLLDRQLQGKVSHNSPVDAIISKDTPCPYQIDVGRIWKQPRKYYHLDALMRTIVGRNYSCDVVLVKNNLNSILSKMAGKIPQFLDLDVPEESEGAFDSKQETV